MNTPMSTKPNTKATSAGPDRSGGIRFEAPGPGSWELDLSHQSHTHGRLNAELFSSNFTEGFRTCFARYGMPLEAIVSQSVNGWHYTKAKPVGAPEGGSKPPPDFVLKIATRLVPELRRRNHTARQALETKLWMSDAQAWEVERDGWIGAGEALLADPIAELDDADLEAHARRCVELTQRMFRRHFELVGAAVGTGRLLVAGAEWDLDPTDVLGVLQGASPASSATIAPLRVIADLVAASGEQPATLAQLTALSPEIADLVAEYLRIWGWRVLGDDIESSTLMDHPDDLIGLIDAVGASNGTASSPVSRAIEKLRSAVPATERDRFDELVDEARRSYGSLDDNSGVTCWIVGIARRAMLEVAKRAVQTGRLVEISDVWNLSIDEMQQIAGGGAAPEPVVMDQRRTDRAAAVNPPTTLGPESVGGPPSHTVFPKAMGEMVAAFGAFITGKFGGESPSTTPLAGQLLIGDAVVGSGHGVGSEAVTARVVVADDVSDAFDRLEPGDILVCPYTTAAWNTIFPLLGGLVTATGGPISHAGVMAREFGLSAVIGIGDIEPGWDGSTATLRPAAV